MSTLHAYQQYMRRYRLMIYGDAGAIDVSNLRCVFHCEKNMNEDPNFSQITVYNLNKSTIGSIKDGDKVILEAGYKNGNYGMIFTGEIVQAYTSKEDNTDLALCLVVQDGDRFLTSSFTAKTLGKASTQADIVNACLGDGVRPGLISSEAGKKSLPRGRVLFGLSSNVIEQVAEGISSQFYIEDGEVNIVSATDYGSGFGVELNPETGLIGIPSQTDDGVSGQCLINPSIKLNTLVHIDAGYITPKQKSASSDENWSAVDTDGVYRIFKIVYEGDTHGDAWYCTFEGLTQPGSKPTGLVDGATNPWR